VKVETRHESIVVRGCHIASSSHHPVRVFVDASERTDAGADQGTERRRISSSARLNIAIQESQLKSKFIAKFMLNVEIHSQITDYRGGCAEYN